MDSSLGGCEIVEEESNAVRSGTTRTEKNDLTDTWRRVIFTEWNIKFLLSWKMVLKNFIQEQKNNRKDCLHSIGRVKITQILFF